MRAVGKPRQQEITEWFNATYARKGDSYLRPTRAYYVFLELLQARPKQVLLDVACGLGRLLEAASEYELKLHGVDVSPVAVDKAQQNVPQASITCGNAEQLPFDDATFDLVTCIGSLERIIDPVQALAEMRRVGKPDARFCLMVRNSETLSWKFRSRPILADNAGHAGANTLQEWTRLFETNGFVIEAILPDQYPLHVRRQWRSLFLRKVDFREAIPAPLENANEFIFLLKRHS